MRKITYTKKFHVHRLKLMLNRKEPCKTCPAADSKSRSLKIASYIESHYLNDPCKTCCKFVGVKYRTGFNSTCPCMKFGSSTAITKTLKEIEEFEKETK